jgi:hypothetical protein
VVRLLSNLDVRGATSWDALKGDRDRESGRHRLALRCWSVSAEYVNRHNDENEFRFMVNLLGVGQTGSSARAGF